MTENFDGGDYLDMKDFQPDKSFTISFWAKSKDSAKHAVFTNGIFTVNAKLQSGAWHHVAASYEGGELTSLNIHVIFSWYKRFFFWLFPGMKEPSDIKISGLSIQ